MRVCFVLEHFYPHVGGVETIFAEFVKRLVRAGHEVRVVTSNSGGVSGKADFEGASVYYLHSRSFFGHPLLPQRRVADHVQWADIIHTTTYTAAPIAHALASKFHKPIVISVQEAIGRKWHLIEKNVFKAMAFWMFERFVVTRRYSAWHVISYATQRDLLRYGIKPEKIDVIYPGVDESIWNTHVSRADIAQHFGFEPACKVFLYTGRPGKPKGLFVLLEAIKKVHTVLDMSFKFGFMLSDDPLSEKRKFLKEIEASGLVGRVNVTGSVPYLQLPGLRKAAYAVIVPSLTEGFGFSAVETAYVGTPIIASTAGSLPEVLGVGALFFENNNPADLASKIIQAARGKFPTGETKAYSWEKALCDLQVLYVSSLGR